MYGVVEIGGKQYHVEPGMEVVHEVVPGVGVGDTITFDRVLLLRNGDGVAIGRPYLSGVKVIAEVREVGRGKKAVVQRFAPKKGYRRKKGYRQPYMRTKIVAIEKD